MNFQARAQVILSSFNSSPISVYSTPSLKVFRTHVQSIYWGVSYTIQQKWNFGAYDNLNYEWICVLVKHMLFSVIDYQNAGQLSLFV